jgi:hypothetical protein
MPAPIMSATSRCRNCGRVGEHEPIFTAQLGTSRCSTCGAWSVTAPPDAPEAVYGESYFAGGEYWDYVASESVHRRNFERKWRILSRHRLLPAGAPRVVEVGAATGEFGRVVLDDGGSGAQYLGVEVSEFCRGKAAGKGLRILSPSSPELPDGLRRLKPNLVVGWDVWEHLSDPAAEFDRLLADADPRVTVALTTVDTGSWIATIRGYRWRQFHIRTHLNYPSRRSFVYYFLDRGFRIGYHRAFGYFRPLAEYLRPLAGPSRRRGAAPGRLARLPLYLNLYDTQMVVAMRTP